MTHLLTLKRLTLRFTNPLVNVAITFNFLQVHPLKVETQRVCWICSTFRYNQTQFRRVEVPLSGTSRGVSTLISSIIWTRKNNTSFKSNYIQAFKWRKNTWKVYKWIFQIVITKNVSSTCIFNQLNLFLIALFTRLFLLYSNVH